LKSNKLSNAHNTPEVKEKKRKFLQYDTNARNLMTNLINTGQQLKGVLTLILDHLVLF